MSEKLEKIDEQRFGKWCKIHNWWTQKVRFAQKGYPDRIYIHRVLRIRCWIEWKRIGEEPYPLQYERIAELRSLGENVTWTDNFNDAVHYLETLESEALSAPRDKNAPQSGGSGTLSRSWPRENDYSPRGNKDIDSEGSNF